MHILLTRNARLVRALRYGVAASVESLAVLRNLDCDFVVDIGANRGQFALAARHTWPSAQIVSFEPLPIASAVYWKVFQDDFNVRLHVLAIGDSPGSKQLHISARDDSSSLLPIAALQESIFPGTAEVGVTDVQVVRLSDVLDEVNIARPALLKLDVQGYELSALIGCRSLLHMFDFVLCECSFQELYVDQKLAGDITSWLDKEQFKIAGIYNTTYDGEGVAVQSDFLFERVGKERY